MTNWVPDQHSIYLRGQHTHAFYTKRVMVEEQGTCVDELVDIVDVSPYYTSRYVLALREPTPSHGSIMRAG